MNQYIIDTLIAGIQMEQGFISDAHYGYSCYKENGSGYNKQKRDEMILDANNKIQIIVDFLKSNNIEININEI